MNPFTLLIFLTLTLTIFPSSSPLLTVHVLPHSHQDPGWIKTLDEYYTTSVEKIFNSIYESLLSNPNRTFNYEEIVYFKRWYDSKNETVKENMKKFLQEKRIVFLNGGWVMEDQSLTYYNDLINQARLGFEFLHKEFNYKPEIGWFIDQFGHSSTYAYIYKKLGIKKAVINRIYDELINNFYSNKNLQLYWQPFDEGFKDDKIFVHFNYHPNDWFIPPDSITSLVLDKNVSDADLVDDKTLHELYNQLNRLKKGFRHDHITIFYGNDFHFYNGDTNYKNMERLMNVFNEKYKDEVVLKYSTIEQYFNEVEKIDKEKSLNFITFTGDFVPYIGDYRSIWTGFYTSRPFLKGTIYENSILLTQSSKVLFEYFLHKKEKEKMKDFYEKQISLFEAVSVCQHHDAITGTAKSNVSDDYVNMLNKGRNLLNNEMINGYKNMLVDNKENNDNNDNNNDNNQLKGEWENIKICLNNGKVGLGCNVDFNLVFNKDKNGNNNEIIINIFNNDLVDSNILINIETNYIFRNVAFDIIDIANKNNKIKYDKYCINKYKCYIVFFYAFKLKENTSFFPIKISNIRSSHDGHQNNKQIEECDKCKEELNSSPENNPKKEPIFQPYLYQSSMYYIPLSSYNDQSPPLNIISDKDNIQIKDLSYNVKKNEFTLTYNKMDKKPYIFSLIHSKYDTTGGAYIFDATRLFPTDIKILYENSLFIKGEISNCIMLKTIDTYLMIIVYKYPFFIQTISVTVPVKGNNINRSNDLVLTLKTNIDSNNYFYTDTAGIKMQKRLFPLKESFKQLYKYDLSISMRTGEQFYPVTKLLSIIEKDDENNNKNNNKMGVYFYNDRPQMGALVEKGRISLTINRWTNGDDGKGVFENLFEKQSMNNYFDYKHLIVFNSGSNDNDYVTNSIAKMFFRENLIAFMHGNKWGKWDLFENKIDNTISYYSSFSNSNTNNVISNKFLNNFHYKNVDGANKIFDNLFRNYFVYNANFIKVDILFIRENKAYVQFFNIYDEFFKMDYGKYSNVVSVFNGNLFGVKICDNDGTGCSINKNGYDTEIEGFMHFIVKPLDLVVLEITFK